LNGNTPLSSIVMVLTASFIGSFGAVFLKLGANHLHRNVLTIFVNWRLGIGVVFFVSSSLLYLQGIRDGELTILYPMVSLGYVWTLFWSRLFFQEPFTRNKFIGLALILSGIVLLALSNR
jgi:drug/metabolite transporter (DMT)-like permease